MRRLAFVVGIAALVVFGLVTWLGAQTRTVAWDHDGVATDGYAVIVDGTRTVVTAACSGTPRTCTAPLPALGAGPTHTVIVTAFNVWGETSSDPLTGSAPGKPANVRVK